VPRYSFEWEITLRNLAVVVVCVLLSGAAFVAMFHAMPHTPGLRRLVLTKAVSSEEGYVVDSFGQRGLIAREGVALSPLRPAGTAEFDGERLQVVTEGDFIEKDEPIRITDVSGNRITVTRA